MLISAQTIQVNEDCVIEYRQGTDEIARVFGDYWILSCADSQGNRVSLILNKDAPMRLRHALENPSAR